MNKDLYITIRRPPYWIIIFYAEPPPEQAHTTPDGPPPPLPTEGASWRWKDPMWYWKALYSRIRATRKRQGSCR